MATVKLSPPLLQELRKAMAAKKGARAIGASKIKGPTLPVSHRQRETTKRKATLDAAGEPAARRPATEAPSQSAPTDTSAQRPDGLTPATSGLAYAAVVAGRAIPHPSSGPLKPIAKGSAHANPAAPSEAALRRNSSELSGPLSGMPVGATFPQAPEINAVLVGQRRNKTPLFLLQVSATRVASWPGCGPHVVAVSRPKSRPNALFLSQRRLMDFEPRSQHSGHSMPVGVCLSTPSRCRRTAV
jgi:hypothetical protein